MLITVNYLLSLIIAVVTMYGYGSFIKIKNDIFFTLISGYFIIGIIALIFHFITPIFDFLSLIIIIFGFILAFLKIQNLDIKKTFKFFIFLIFISFLLIGKSEQAIDANMYHHPYISYLKSEKIIFGIANLHFRFGHISFLQYVQSIFDTNFFSDYSLSNINIILFTSFLIFCGQVIIKKNINVFLFLLTLFISSFLLIKFGRYNEFGNDLIPFLVASYFLIKIFEYNNKFTSKDNSDLLIFFPLFSIFMLSHKVSYLFSSLIFIVLLNKKSFIELIKNKLIIFLFTFITIIWLSKNFIETSCLIYPVIQTCIENTNWYLTGAPDPKNVLLSSEVWAKGWVDRPKNFNLNWNEFNSSFNWLTIWMNNHLIKILEKISPLLIIFIITSIYLLVNKNKETINSKNYNSEYFNLIKILIYISFGLTIWFLKAPLFRYGAFYITSFLILLFLVFNFKLIYKVNSEKIKKLKIIFFISLIFFVSKNLKRQITSEYSFYPFTKPEYKNYIVINKDPYVVKPNEKLVVCFYSKFLCSHQIPKKFEIFKINGYFFMKNLP